MIVLLSPAKRMSFEEPAKFSDCTQPSFLQKSEELVEKLKTLKPEEIKELMGVSDKIAVLNYERFQSFQPPFSLENAKQAAYAFQGDTYIGLDFDSFSNQEVKRAQKTIRILSGLYGWLSPLDLIQPYRLEMGTSFQVDKKHSNLYSFWKEELTEALHSTAKKTELIVNCASNEYSKAVDLKSFSDQVVTPVFKEKNKGAYKVIGLMSKKARGAMASYIVKENIKDLEGLKKFSANRYKFSSKDSTDSELVFLEK